MNFHWLRTLTGSVLSSLEIVEVLQGVRGCARLAMPAHSVELLADHLAARGHALAQGPARVPLRAGGYSASSTPPVQGGQTWQEIYIASKVQVAVALQAASRADEHRATGALLEYPSCCIDFFMGYLALGQENGMDFRPYIPHTHGLATWPMNVFAADSGALLLSFFPCDLCCPAALRIAESRASLLRLLSEDTFVQFRKLMTGSFAHRPKLADLDSNPAGQPARLPLPATTFC